MDCNANLHFSDTPDALPDDREAFSRFSATTSSLSQTSGLCTHRVTARGSKTLTQGLGTSGHSLALTAESFTPVDHIASIDTEDNFVDRERRPSKFDEAAEFAIAS